MGQRQGCFPVRRYLSSCDRPSDLEKGPRRELCQDDSGVRDCDCCERCHYWSPHDVRRVNGDEPDLLRPEFKVLRPVGALLSCSSLHGQMVHGAHGSVFDTITTRTFETTQVLLPPSEVQKAFDGRVRSLFDRIRVNLQQSRTLADLRDTLLPKLLSGELRVANAVNEVQVVL